MNESAPIASPAMFDFLFIGLGAANCLLILRLNENSLLQGKRICIIEPSSKTSNDRTFCFWSTDTEVANLGLEKLISYSWDSIQITGITTQKISPLRYFHVKSIDLYQETKNTLEKNNVKIYTTALTERPQTKPHYHEVFVGHESISAVRVFDSRPPKFLPAQKNQSHLLQSFYGWKIETSENTFATSSIVMMDFNVPQNDFTQFVYILPFSENTALIELTRFGEKQLLQEEANIILKEYIHRLGVSYEIIEHEIGIIPMSSAEIETEDFGKNWINTGARANLVKCTTGYAFHAMAEDAVFQTESIKKNLDPTRKINTKRFAFYDRLLLKILNERPEKGKLIFETLFKKVELPKALRFLREQTNFVEEITIFSKLPKRLFITAALKDFRNSLNRLPIVLFPFFFTILAICFSLLNVSFISWTILGIGFFSIGLSHGALDHLATNTTMNSRALILFSGKYVIKGLLLGIVWIIYPDLALLLFIAYSAWHFGQADFKEWKIQPKGQTFLWGIIVLSTILLFHFEELIIILKQIPDLNIVTLIEKASPTHITSLQIIAVVVGIIFTTVKKSTPLVLTFIYLLFSSYLPLLLSFGIYFVGQHSVHGWRHLSAGLNEKSSNLWLKSLPFNFGGTLLILLFTLFAGMNYIGIFFILLSCLSMPHVLSMHHFYSKLGK